MAIQQPLGMDIVALREAVRQFLLASQPFVDRISEFEWKPSDGFLSMILRAIARRQFDCLSSVVELASKSQGYSAVPLLRPACEEFIWVSYLLKLQPRDAERVLRCVAQTELLDSLQAQDNFAGRSTSKKLGLAKYLRSSQSRAHHVQAELRALAKELDWGKKAEESGRGPTLGLLARQVGQVKLYNFLYHASSRFVHFSPAELLRRAWGKAGQVSIHSKHFAEYWSAFALHWGTSLIAQTLAEVAGSLPANDEEDQLDAAAVLAAAERVGAYGWCQ